MRHASRCVCAVGRHKAARVLVTGASKGIGLATVRMFLAEGASVTAVSRRSTPELEATAATFLSADLSAPDGPRRMVENVLAADPRLDVLVNNAGGGTLPDGVLADPFGGGDDVWDRVFALNLYAAVRITRAALPALTEARGAVVNVGSDSSLMPHSNPLSYTSAKAALNAFSRGLAENVGGSGVRVNTVAPGLTRTPYVTGEDGVAAKMAAAMGVDQAAVIDDFPAPERRGDRTDDRPVRDRPSDRAAVLPRPAERRRIELGPARRFTEDARLRKRSSSWPSPDELPSPRARNPSQIVCRGHDAGPRVVVGLAR